MGATKKSFKDVKIGSTVYLQKKGEEKLAPAKVVDASENPRLGLMLLAKIGGASFLTYVPKAEAAKTAEHYDKKTQYIWHTQSGAPATEKS